MKGGSEFPHGTPPSGFYVAGAWTAAGLATTIYVRNPQLKMRIAFDMGYFSEKVLSADHVFISHGHTDHIGAIFSHARGHNLGQNKPVRYYVPPAILPPLLKLRAALEELDGGPIPCELVPLGPGDPPADLGRGVTARAFATDHRVPSQGYAIFSKSVKGLKEEYRGKPKNELIALKKAGVEINRVVETTEVVYSGDTTLHPFISRRPSTAKNEDNEQPLQESPSHAPFQSQPDEGKERDSVEASVKASITSNKKEFQDQHGDARLSNLSKAGQWAWAARLLLLEVTYLEREDARERRNACERKHVHLGDLFDHDVASLSQNQQIVFVHLSKKYRHHRTACEVLARNIPQNWTLLPRVYVCLHLFGHQEFCTAILPVVKNDEEMQVSSEQEICTS